MALTNDEKAYVKRLRQAWADDENVLFYLKERRSKEAIQNQPKQQGVFSKIAQAPVAFWQGLVTGTIRGVGNIAKFGGNIVDKALPGDYLKRGTEALQRGTEWLAGGIEWINKDVTENVGQNVGQFASNLVGGMWLVKWGAKLATRGAWLLWATKTGSNLLWRTAPLTSQLWKIGQFAKGSTLWAKATNLWLKSAKYWAIWGVETAGYDIASKGEISPTNVAIGSVFSAMLPVAGAIASKWANYVTKALPKRLQGSNIMTPWDLKNVSDRYSKLTGKEMDMDTYSKWALDRWIRGSEAEQRKMIADNIANLKTQKKTVFSNYTKEFSDDSVESLKNALREKVANYTKKWLPTAGNEKLVSQYNKLINKKALTLWEIDEGRSLLWKNLFTKTWSEKDIASKEGWQEVWKKTSQYLDDRVDWFRALNKDIEIGIAAEKAIAKKEASALARQIAGYLWFGGISGAITGAVTWDFGTWVKVWLASVWLGWLTRILRSPKVLSNTAYYLNKLSPEGRKAMEALKKGRLNIKQARTLSDELKLLPPPSGKPLSVKNVKWEMVSNNGTIPISKMADADIIKQSNEWYSKVATQRAQQAISSKVWTQPLTTATQQNPWLSGVTPLLSTQWVQPKILPKVPWEKVIPPIIPKTPVKAKLRTNEDALRKAESKLPQATSGNKWIDNVNRGIMERSWKMVNSLMDELWDKAKYADWTSNELAKALDEWIITLDEAIKIKELRTQKWMGNSAFEKINKTGAKSELRWEPSWSATIRNFKEKQSKLPKSESAKVGAVQELNTRKDFVKAVEENNMEALKQAYYKDKARFNTFIEGYYGREKFDRLTAEITWSWNTSFWFIPDNTEYISPVKNKILELADWNEYKVSNIQKLSNEQIESWIKQLKKDIAKQEAKASNASERLRTNWAVRVIWKPSGKATSLNANTQNAFEMVDNYKADLKLYEAILDSRTPQSKSSLPMAEGSAVKYSEAVKPEKAIKEYTNDSTKINKAIRSWDINEKVLAIDKFLEQQATHKWQSYRWLTKNASKVDDFIDKIKKEWYSDEAYTSSSSNFWDATTFSRTSNSEWKIGVILELEWKNWKIVPSKFNAYNEEEVIYPRGSKFDFVKEYTKDGRRVIVLKQK